MKKVPLIIIFTLLFLGGSLYVFAQTGNSPMKKTPQVIMEDTIHRNESEMADTTRYLPYTKGVLEKNVDKKRVLFFYANWCSTTCIPADLDFQKHSARIPEDVRLIRIDYQDSDTDSEEKALADKYAVTYQHTFVQIDAKGNVITKWNGGQTDGLLSHLK